MLFVACRKFMVFWVTRYVPGLTKQNGANTLRHVCLPCTSALLGEAIVLGPRIAK